MLMRRLTLAQLEHKPDTLRVMVDEMCDAGPDCVWHIASLLSAAVSNMLLHFSGYDRASATRRAAEDPLSAMVPSVTAGQRQLSRNDRPPRVKSRHLKH